MASNSVAQLHPLLRRFIAENMTFSAAAALFVGMIRKAGLAGDTEALADAVVTLARIYTLQVEEVGIATLALLLAEKTGLDVTPSARAELLADFPCKSAISTQAESSANLNLDLDIRTGNDANTKAIGSAVLAFASKQALETNPEAAGSANVTLPRKASIGTGSEALASMHATLAEKTGMDSGVHAVASSRPVIAKKTTLAETTDAGGGLAFVLARKLADAFGSIGEANLTVDLTEQKSNDSQYDAEANEEQSQPRKLQVSMSMASFSTVTPPGACGSLPATLTLRLSGHTGTCSTLDGRSATLTFSSISNVWTGNLSGSGTPAIAFACNATTHQWTLNMSGTFNATVTGFSGSSGPNPNLSAVGSVTGGCTGNETFTITRT